MAKISRSARAHALIAAFAATFPLLALAAAPARAALAEPEFAPNEVLVAYHSAAAARLAGDVEHRLGETALSPGPSAGEQVVRLARGETVPEALARFRLEPGVAYAVPDYIAHAASGGWYPDDPGRSDHRRGWENLQWNFLPGAGVDAPMAWASLIADHRSGGRGVAVAVLDSGIAYRNWRRFRQSPDFDRTRFVAPYDFIAHNRFPLDREGHGTFVAGTIAESTNNGIGVTGLAYGVSIMPVRVLDAEGTGDGVTVAQGIRYAVDHHAKVINLSLEFSPDVTAADIPDVIDALRYADRRGVTVVAAAGNDGADEVAYPARTSSVISVGATTRDRCLTDYSNVGPDLDLVAPGGGQDNSMLSDPNCHPGRSLPPIYQMTFLSQTDPRRFGLPGGIYGTSMSAPHVAAAAALIIASRVLGPHPTPAQILQRLEQTAQPLGTGRPNQDYGWGLIDVGAATTGPSPF